MDSGMAKFFTWAGILALAVLSTGAFAATCEPDENTWVPSRYYPPGKTVFHNSNWYESRKLHEGKTPGSDFEWKKLESAPECGSKERDAITVNEGDQQQQPQATGQKLQKPEKSRNKAGQSCNEPGRWGFGASYTVGQMAVHQGQTYRAIRPSNGQMPGMSQPPHWEPVDHPCKQKTNKGN